MQRSGYSVRLDEKVIITMIALSVIGLIFMAFRYKSYEPCSSFRLNIYANYFDVGNTIFFRTPDAKNAEEWEWDFGDKSPTDKSSGPITNHVYKEPGKYIVSLTVNGECKQYENVVINSVRKDSIRFVTPQVIWPAEPVMVGQNVVFTDVTNGAHSWEWYIGEGKDSKRFTTKDVSYTFTSAGMVPVKLFVNSNIDARQERVIKVENAPPPVAPYVNNNRPVRQPSMPSIKDRPEDGSLFERPRTEETSKEEKPKAPRLTSALFTQMIKGVIDHSVNESDFAPYICDNKNVRVSFNGDNLSFSESISKLKTLKKLKSLKAAAYTDPGTNCILNISIVYDKRNFLVF